MSDRHHVWDPGLQAERTSLAWHRLAVALLGLALVLPKLGWDAIGAWALVPTSLVAAGAITILLASNRRYHQTHRHLTSNLGAALPDGRLLLVSVLAALFLAAVGSVVIVADLSSGF